jgi:NUMOD4 motif/HNH endonuclease
MDTIETWKDIEGYERLYQVSNLGQVRSLNRKDTNGNRQLLEKILKPSKTKKGYLRVCLCVNSVIKTFSVHRLVAIEFIPNSDNKPEINHINGIKHDNSVNNLEWATARENRLHACREGLAGSTKGSSHGCSKLCETSVLNIRKQLASGILVAIVAKEFQVSIDTIYNIKARKSWKHV